MNFYDTYGIGHVFHVCYLIYSFDKAPKRSHLYVLVKCLASWGWEVVWALAVPVAAWYLESILLKRRLAERSCVKNHLYANLCCLFGNHRIDEWWDDADKQLFLCKLLRINLFSEGIIGWAVWRSLKWATGWGRAGFHQVRLTNGTLFIFFWYFSPKPLSCEGASRMFAHGKS